MKTALLAKATSQFICIDMLQQYSQLVARYCRSGNIKSRKAFAFA